MLGLRFCARAFSSCGEWGPLFIAVRGPLTVAASLVGSTGSRRAGSVIVAQGPSRSAACGIFPDQGLNPCPLHWQADSQLLPHQGSPRLFKLLTFPLWITLMCISRLRVRNGFILNGSCNIGDHTYKRHFLPFSIFLKLDLLRVSSKEHFMKWKCIKIMTSSLPVLSEHSISHCSEQN